MELSEIELKADDILRNFVNCLGFDGDYYISSNKCPIIFADIGVPGMFYTAESKKLRKFLSNLDIDNKKKKYILEEGLILVNSEYKDKKVDDELFITLVHEMLHSNRMLLLNSQRSDNEEINSVFYNNNHFEQNSNNSKSYYADASQDIFKGSVDNSRRTIESYANLTDEEKEDISFFDEKYGNKMYQQQVIDEALVELMAIVAYRLYVSKSTDIMKYVKEIYDKYDGDDMRAIASIILRHNDLELFKWMIDPLSYQNYDVNYDFFSNYLIKEDMNDYELMMNDSDVFFDDDKMDEEILRARSK